MIGTNPDILVQIQCIKCTILHTSRLWRWACMHYRTFLTNLHEIQIIGSRL